MLTTCHWTGAVCTLCTLDCTGVQWRGPVAHPALYTVPSTPWTSTSRPALPLLQPSLHPLKVRTVCRDVSEIQRRLAAREICVNAYKHSRNIPVTCELVITTSHSSIVKLTLNQHKVFLTRTKELAQYPSESFPLIMHEVIAS